MKHMGITKNTIAQSVAMCEFAQGKLKLKKPRKLRATGMKYDRAEDRLRPLVIKALRKKGWKVTRVEPSFRGEFNLGDLWVSHVYRKLAGWVEVKSPTGRQSLGQIGFEEICYNCGVNYWLITSEEEAKAL